MQKKLGGGSSGINWFIGDLLNWQPDHPVDLWHDRAVFHFRTDSGSVNDYLRSVHRGVRRGWAPNHALFCWQLKSFHFRRRDGPENCLVAAVAITAEWKRLTYADYGGCQFETAVVARHIVSKSYDASNWVEVNAATAMQSWNHTHGWSFWDHINDALISPSDLNRRRGRNSRTRYLLAQRL